MQASAVKLFCGQLQEKQKRWMGGAVFCCGSSFVWRASIVDLPKLVLAHVRVVLIQR
jgi:hypothetical protein